jgi:hypothetical protein
MPHDSRGVAQARAISYRTNDSSFIRIGERFLASFSNSMGGNLRLAAAPSMAEKPRLFETGAVALGEGASSA